MRRKGAALDKRVLDVKEAAAELFSTRGFLETSMEDIARASNLSKGGMYHYFHSKTEILFAILSDFMDRVLGDIDLVAAVEDPQDQLSLLVHRHVDTYVRHMHAARVLLKEANNLPQRHLKKIRQKERLYLDAVKGVVLRLLGPEAGKDISTVVTFSLLGMCNWIYSWYDPKGRVDPDRLSETIIALFTSGVQSLAPRNGQKG